MRRARERAYCSRLTRTLMGLCQPWRATSPSAAALTCCMERRLFPSPVRGGGTWWEKRKVPPGIRVSGNRGLRGASCPFPTAWAHVPRPAWLRLEEVSTPWGLRGCPKGVCGTEEATVLSARSGSSGWLRSSRWASRWGGGAGSAGC